MKTRNGLLPREMGMKKWVLLAVLAWPLGGCCVISCNARLPNSYIKVGSPVAAECTYEDKLGLRKFSAPGDVLGMPKNAPGVLVCTAKGYKPYRRTFLAEDWNPLTPISGDPDAMRYYIEVDLVLEPANPGAGK